MRMVISDEALKFKSKIELIGLLEIMEEARSIGYLVPYWEG